MNCGCETIASSDIFQQQIKYITKSIHSNSLQNKSFCKQSKKISNDLELIQSDPTSCPQNQKGNN